MGDFGFTKVGDKILDLEDGYVNVNGVWREIREVYTKVSGNWLLASKGSAIIPIYGAPNETVTIRDGNGVVVYNGTADNSGYVGTKELKFDTYTIEGGDTGYTSPKKVDRNTSMIGAFPDNTYFWHGYQLPGGWTRNGYADSHGNLGSATVASGQLRVASGSTPHRSALLGTVNPINVSNISKVRFRVDIATNAAWCAVGVTKDPSQCQANGITTSSCVTVELPHDKSTDTLNNVIVDVDVSSLSGEWYPYVISWIYDYYESSMTVSRVWANY